MVRAATIAVRSPASSGAGDTTERMLALWLPGDEPIALAGWTRLRAAGLGGARRSRALSKDVGVRAQGTARPKHRGPVLRATPATAAVQALKLAPDYAAVATADRFAFRRMLTEDARALAIYPEAGLDNTSVKVVATRPDGTRADLIAFHPRPDWSRRYWFREPIPLPRGTTIEVTALVRRRSAAAAA